MFSGSIFKTFRYAFLGTPLGTHVVLCICVTMSLFESFRKRLRGNFRKFKKGGRGCNPIVLVDKERKRKGGRWLAAGHALRSQRGGGYIWVVGQIHSENNRQLWIEQNKYVQYNLWNNPVNKTLYWNLPPGRCLLGRSAFCGQVDLENSCTD